MTERHDDLFIWDGAKNKADKHKSSSKDEIKELKKELEQKKENIFALTENISEKEAEIAKLTNDLLRAHADFDNFRKRTRAQSELDYNRAITSVLKDTLNILDDFDRALHACKRDEADGNFYDGIELIYKGFMTLLERYGVKLMEVSGKTFDPNLHEAVARIQTDEVDEYTIVGELQKGYLLGDTLLRPAKVTVAVAPCECEKE